MHNMSLRDHHQQREQSILLEVETSYLYLRSTGRLGIQVEQLMYITTRMPGTLVYIQPGDVVLSVNDLGRGAI